MYSTGVSKRLEDGTYLNAYIPVKFKKGTEPNGAEKDPKESGAFGLFIKKYSYV